MTTYRVRYYECYEGYYDVEANSKEEAENIILNDIAECREEAPDQCYDSGVEVWKMEQECDIDVEVNK